MSLPPTSPPHCQCGSESLPHITSLPPGSPSSDLSHDSVDMLPIRTLPPTSPSRRPRFASMSPVVSFPTVLPSSGHGDSPQSDDMSPSVQPVHENNSSDFEDMSPARDPPVEPRNRRDPCRFGEIKGFPVGSRWPDRKELSLDGVHAPIRAGIHGKQAEGCYSIVLSGGYADDIDMGEELTYTGNGGRQPSEEGMKWNSAQVRDQEWKRENQALRSSHYRGTPVRVIRGHTLPSEWAPTEGYRYDGLYEVTECKRGKSDVSDFLVCRFLLRRLPNQLALPTRNQPVRHPMRPEVSQRGWNLGYQRSTLPALHREAGPLAVRTKDAEMFNGKGKGREVEMESPMPMVPPITVKPEPEESPAEDQDMDDFYCSEAEEKEWENKYSNRGDDVEDG